MDNITKEKLNEIINREIKLEDDMLGLYAEMLKGDSFLSKFDEEDYDIASEIINVLLRDTKRHKETMESMAQNL